MQRAASAGGTSAATRRLSSAIGGAPARRSCTSRQASTSTAATASRRSTTVWRLAWTPAARPGSSSPASSTSGTRSARPRSSVSTVMTSPAPTLASHSALDLDFWSGGVVQNVEAAAMNLYVIYRHADGSFIDATKGNTHYRHRGLRHGDRRSDDPVLIATLYVRRTRPPPYGESRPHPGRLSSFQASIFLRRSHQVACTAAFTAPHDSHFWVKALRVAHVIPRAGRRVVVGAPLAT